MSTSIDNLAVPQSILDTDLYKLTMQQAVLQHFPDVHAIYRFTNRDRNVLFSRQCVERFRTAISHFSFLSLTEEEHDWVKETCPYFTETYTTYLSSYRYKPEQVQIDFVLTPNGKQQLGELTIEISGPWVETILWEVPVMACLSETYFQTMDKGWDYHMQKETAHSKGMALLEAGCTFSDFGTRRRRSYHAQDLVIQSLIQASQDSAGKGRFLGTSNMHFARVYGTDAIGTVAHEWFMGVAALTGYKNANSQPMDLWEDLYGLKAPLIALTDTFSTAAFFQDFTSDPERARRWGGLRQDSGDPFAFGPIVKKMYEDMNIDPSTKTIVFSDALTVDKAIKIQKQCTGLGMSKVSFGIGTYLTNDFQSNVDENKGKSKALNMVIKLSSVDQQPCIKISDDLNKTTGDKQTVDHVMSIYNILNN